MTFDGPFGSDHASEPARTAATYEDVKAAPDTMVPQLDLRLAHFEDVPTWVAEVLSPGNERHDRVKKLRVYPRAGVGHAWLVHPEQRTVEVFERRDGVWSLVDAHEDDAVVRILPFDAIELELATLWLAR